MRLILIFTRVSIFLIRQLAYFAKYGVYCLTNKIISSYRILKKDKIGKTKMEKDSFPAAVLARFAVSRVPELSVM